MQYAHKVSKLVVGRYYLVAHAEIIFDNNTRIHHIPVLPHLHKDPQFGKAGEFEHYHIDGRFYASAFIRYRFRIDENGKTNYVIYLQKEPSFLGNYIVKSIVYKKTVCMGLTTGVRPPVESIYPDDAPYMKWYNKYIGKSCKGKKCPHFGTMMIEDNGVLSCPMHGLHADSKTEIIIKHPDRIQY